MALKKQACVALSTTEAEYIAAGSYCAQSIWIKNQLEDYGIHLDHIPLKCDNTSAINLTKNPVLHSKTKHIEIRHHFIRDHVSKGECKVEYIDTQHQLADIIPSSFWFLHLLVCILCPDCVAACLPLALIHYRAWLSPFCVSIASHSCLLISQKEPANPLGK